jgi:DHA1 family bicyclomycin/chloramphenicol resistance-like MFS transporter
MPLRLLLVLGALSAFGPLAIDFYLPSFPALALAFATDVEHVQLSLAVYFVGLAIGQLVYGPLADRFGRRIPLLVGVTLFSLASLACALAPSLEWLVAARFIQALGGCAGMVVSRAVVRDLCDPINSAKVFSQLMLVMGLAPILAPLAGGLLLRTLGWPSIFISLALFSFICLLAVAKWLPETLAKEGSPAPLRGALGQYKRLFADLPFLGYALTGGCAVAGMFAYIAGSPFVFIELYGIPAEHFGWLFGSNAVGFILVALAKPQALWPLLVPLFGCIASLGILLPNASACAMAGQGRHAGSASALLGSLQFVIAASAAAMVGVLHDGSAWPIAVVICGCGVLVVGFSLFTRWAERRTIRILG